MEWSWQIDIQTMKIVFGQSVTRKIFQVNLPTSSQNLRTLTLGGSTPGWEPARGGSDKCKVCSYLQPHLTWQCLLEKKYRYSTIAAFTLARAARWNIGLMIRSWSCPVSSLTFPCFRPIFQHHPTLSTTTCKNLQEYSQTLAGRIF